MEGSCKVRACRALAAEPSSGDRECRQAPSRRPARTASRGELRLPKPALIPGPQNETVVGDKAFTSLLHRIRRKSNCSVPWNSRRRPPVLPRRPRRPHASPHAEPERLQGTVGGPPLRGREDTLSKDGEPPRGRGSPRLPSCPPRAGVTLGSAPQARGGEQAGFRTASEH